MCAVLLGLRTVLKKWVKETLAAIKEVGIKETVMLTGDNEPTAKALALYAGIDTYYSELLPKKKLMPFAISSKDGEMWAWSGTG